MRPSIECDNYINVTYYLCINTGGRDRLQIIVADDVSALEDYLHDDVIHARTEGEANVDRYWHYVVQHCDLLWHPTSIHEARLLYEYIRLTAAYT